MEPSMPLNPDPMSSYGYSAYPCDFPHVTRELEAMSGTEVNAILETAFDSRREILRTSGKLGLAETIDWSKKEKWLRYGVGEAGAVIQISETRFKRGQLVPGIVWMEFDSGIVLTVERRHFPPERIRAEGTKEG